jgi:hypothetical protein
MLPKNQTANSFAPLEVRGIVDILGWIASFNWMEGRMFDAQTCLRNFAV